MEEKDIQRRLKAIRIKNMKVEGKLKYYSQYLLNTFSNSNFEETLKSIKVALEDCEDQVVDLVIDLEEEKELKHRHRMDDLNRKLFNLRNAVSEHEKVSRIPLAPMGVLAPGSAHARPSAQPPMDTSGYFRRTCLQSNLKKNL